MNVNDMDDMLFECNKNAIYVLNTNYAYGEFGRLNLFGGATTVNSIPISSNEVSSRGQRSSSQTCRGGDSLYRSSSTTLVSSNLTTEVPHISATERSTLLATAAATSSSSSRTIPKLFHYSPNQHSDHLLQNHNLNTLPYDTHHDDNHHHHPHQHRQQQQQLKQAKTKYSPLSKSSGLTSSTTSLGRVTSCTTTTTTSKKSSNLKSTIIAKKTKFWKYLEEEKWKKSTSVGNLTTTNCERNSDGSLLKMNNGGMINNNNGGGVNNSNTVINNGGGRSKNNTDDSNNQKSSTELYKEAAELLGLSCTLCDNCRCLDCQSRYFECDDSDSYSEVSFLGDYFDMYDDRHSHHQQNVRHSQQLNGTANNVDGCSLQSDNSSICSANSNNSESPRDLSLDDSVSITN